METLKTAWRLEEHIFQNIEKRENHLNGKKGPKTLQMTKQNNTIIKVIL